MKAAVWWDCHLTWQLAHQQTVKLSLTMQNEEPNKKENIPTRKYTPVSYPQDQSLTIIYVSSHSLSKFPLSF